MKVRIRAMLPLLAMAFALAACGASGDQAADAESPLPFFLVRQQEPDGYMLALGGGVLTERDGCLFVSSDLVIWPVGTTVERDPDGRASIVDGDGVPIAVVGDTIEMGGGYVAEFSPADVVEPKTEQIEGLEESLGLEIPPRCLSDDVYGVFSASPGIEVVKAGTR